jgi:hypothetical protein
MNEPKENRIRISNTMRGRVPFDVKRRGSTHEMKNVNHLNREFLLFSSLSKSLLLFL